MNGRQVLGPIRENPQSPECSLAESSNNDFDGGDIDYANLGVISTLPRRKRLLSRKSVSDTPSARPPGQLCLTSHTVPSFVCHTPTGC